MGRCGNTRGQVVARCLAALVCCCITGAVPLSAGLVAWESNYGTALALGDDTTAKVDFPFSFPFSGEAHTSGYVSSNGFISLTDNNGPQCCSGDAGKLLNGVPRLAPAWFDLFPPGGGSVMWSTFADHAALTWLAVPTFDLTGTGNANTFQVQMYADGSIVFGYRSFGPQTVGSSSARILIGLSPGIAAADPGPSNFLNQPSFDTGSRTSLYALFAPEDTPNLGGSSFVVRPNGLGGWTSELITPEPVSGVLFLSGGALLWCLRRRTP